MNEAPCNDPVRSVLGYVLSAQRNCAPAGEMQAGQCAQRSCLAGAVASKQCDNITGIDREVQTMDYLELTVRNAQIFNSQKSNSQLAMPSVSGNRVRSIVIPTKVCLHDL